MGLLTTLAGLAFLAAPAWCICNGCQAVRWCQTTWSGFDCCGDWFDWGSGGVAKTAEQANAFAWGNFLAQCTHQVGQGPDKPGSEISGLGGATVDSALVCTGFGSSGNGGVQATLGPGAKLTMGWNDLIPTRSGPDSAYVDINATGSLNGSPQSLGYVRYSDSGAGHFMIEADFSAGGAAYSQVECYLAGALVARGAPQVNGSFGDVLPGGGWPRGTGVTCVLTSAGHSTWIGMGWTTPVSFLIRGDVNPTTCDSVRLIPFQMNSGFSQLASVSIRLKNMSSLTFHRLEFDAAPVVPTPAVSGEPLAALAMLLASLGAAHLRRTGRTNMAQSR